MKFNIQTKQMRIIANVNPSGYTTLLEAIAGKYMSMTQLFHSDGADITFSSGTGYSLIQGAASCGIRQLFTFFCTMELMSVTRIEATIMDQL
jgi:ABC-type uncharacterized transport system ATPase subunit